MWRPQNLCEPMSVVGSDGYPMQITELELRANFDIEWYYGELTDLKFAKGLKSFDKDSLHIIIDRPDIPLITNSLKRVNSIADIPEANMPNFNLIDMGDLQVRNTDVDHVYRKPGNYPFRFVGDPGKRI